MKKNFLPFFFLLLITILLVVGWVQFGENYYYRITFLGTAALFFLLALNFYTFRKRFALRRASLWRLTESQRAQVPLAQAKIEEINKKVQQGLLKNPREILKLGKSTLAPFEISSIYRVEIKSSPSRTRALLSRKEPWGRLNFWYDFHIYGGLLAMVATLIHSNFLPGRTVVTQGLYGLMWIVTLSGLFGWFINAYLPSRLTKMEKEMTLEHLVYLREKLKEQHQAFVQNLTPIQVKSLKAAQRKGDDGLGNFLEPLEDESRDAFLQAFTLYREIEQIQERIYQLRWMRFLLRRWFLIHVPLAIALVLLALLHAAFALYY